MATTKKMDREKFTRMMRIHYRSQNIHFHVANNFVSLKDMQSSIQMILISVAVVLLVLILRIVWVLSQLRRPCPTRRTESKTTVVVLGSGGHTTEMLELIKPLNPEHYKPLVFVVAQTDTTSLRRVQAMKIRSADAIFQIPRSREVGQSYLTSVWTTIFSLISTIGLVIRIRPGLLLCNGPGTCLPIAVWTFLGRILGLWEGKIVFCESFCRVTTLSLTGKLLYPFVDLFLVHWQQLHAQYPKSRLVTTFVPKPSNAMLDPTKPTK